MLLGITVQITPSNADVIEWDVKGKIVSSTLTSAQSKARHLPEEDLTKPSQKRTYTASIAGPNKSPASQVWSRRTAIAQARIAARKHELPEDIFLALVKQESAFKVKALSPKGAYGLAQLMPATARDLGVDPTDPVQNLEGGARYLKQQYLYFGSWPLALAAYNAGPSAVEKYSGIPPYRETQTYVAKILANVATSLQAPTAKSVPTRVATAQARVLSQLNVQEF